MTILRSELYKNLHVGAENEFKAAKIMLYDLVNKDARLIGYGGKVAVSQGHTQVGGDSGKLPLADLRVEGAEGPNHQAKEAFIEHVGGPLSPNRDGTTAQLAAKCLRTFMDELEKLKKSKAPCSVPAMGKEGWHDLSDLIGSYNQAVATLSLADKRYKAFSLREHVYPNCKWLVNASGDVRANTQINVEVPFRKIGLEGTDDIATQF
ncbi:MAG TPA: hypothetical protein VGX78_02325, partial [Pirellulales bacterium]|nr:hypothetical protein [Pirellulales bacterium]